MSKKAALLVVLLASSVCVAQQEKHSQEYLNAEKKSKRFSWARNVSFIIAAGSFGAFLYDRDLSPVALPVIFMALAGGVITHAISQDAGSEAEKILKKERLKNKVSKKKNPKKQRTSKVVSQQKKKREEKKTNPKVGSQSKKSGEKKKKFWSRFKRKNKE